QRPVCPGRLVRRLTTDVVGPSCLLILQSAANVANGGPVPSGVLELRPVLCGGQGISQGAARFRNPAERFSIKTATPETVERVGARLVPVEGSEYLRPGHAQPGGSYPGCHVRPLRASWNACRTSPRVRNGRSVNVQGGLVGSVVK